MHDFEKELIRVANINKATENLINSDTSSTFFALYEHMIKVNEEMNLTAITDTDGVILKHFVDSCAVVPEIPEDATLCDIGCGGGFPTLPVAILRSDVSILGVDSVTKKVEYVKNTSKLLGLDNVNVSNRRAEELGKDVEYREKFDVVLARGVGKLNLLCELCLPLVKIGGCFIAMKAIGIHEEIKQAENAIKTLGAKIEKVIEYTLTNEKETLTRAMIVLKKQTHTPPKYPRNNSQISKKLL